LEITSGEDSIIWFSITYSGVSFPDLLLAITGEMMVDLQKGNELNFDRSKTNLGFSL